LAALLGEKQRALQLMDEALAAGYWYVGLEDDTDFALLHDDPAFARVITTSLERRAAAMTGAQLVLETLEPENGVPPYPLLLAFHGNSSNLASFQPHWRTAAAEGWLVGLPQSSQSYGPDNYSWLDWEWALQDGQKAYQQLITDFPVDRQKVVLAGFSMGAGLAAFLGTGGTVDISGLILVAPFVSQVDNLRPLLAKRHQPNLRVFLVASERDEYCRGIAEQMADLFPQYDIPCKLKVYPDLGHSFPPPFEQDMAEALKFVLPG
jgi:acetyl esterase/lipase